MRYENLLQLKRPAPTVVGTGLVALDVVINGWQSGSPLLSAGGSCGNVMGILAYLGWRAFPVARLGCDLAADFVARDLSRFGVHLEMVYCEKKGRTPIVIETIPVGTSATRTHFFSFTCPHCGAPLPRHRAVLKSSVPQIVKQVSQPSVFYFDRISRAAVDMAKEYSRKGTLIVFEPSSIRNGRLLEECLEVANVIKYSCERVGHMPDIVGARVPFLKIETLGAYGLRFSMSTGNSALSNWEYLETYKVDDVKDEAGSGDWCTAGIVHLLGREGTRSLMRAGRERVLRALSLGQALAALNCRYEGARGTMYCLRGMQLRSAVEDIMAGREIKTTAQRKMPDAIGRLLHSICGTCRNSYKTVDLHRVMTSTGRRRVTPLGETTKRTV